MASPVDQIFRELKSRTTGEVRELICVLESYLCVLEQRIADLEQRVRELEGQVKKDSTNSGKPPSSDGLKRTPKSLREKSGRRPGGQSGREGKALEFSATPDVVEKVPSKSACECGKLLHDAFVTGVERRQVVDVPRAQPVVTEYQGARVKCACCGKEQAAGFSVMLLLE
jgi:transposase